MFINKDCRTRNPGGGVWSRSNSSHLTYT